LNPKNDVSVASGTGFSVTINFPGTPQRPSETVVIEAENVEKPPEKGLETPKITQKTPILLVEDEDYEYAGEDYL
jgi:hypothetical protein